MSEPEPDQKSGDELLKRMLKTPPQKKTTKAPLKPSSKTKTGGK